MPIFRIVLGQCGGRDYAFLGLYLYDYKKMSEKITILRIRIAELYKHVCKLVEKKMQMHSRTLDHNFRNCLQNVILNYNCFSSTIHTVHRH